MNENSGNKTEPSKPKQRFAPRKKKEQPKDDGFRLLIALTERLKSEGNYEACIAKSKQLMAAKPMEMSAAIKLAAMEFGYVSPEDERRIWDEKRENEIRLGIVRTHPDGTPITFEEVVANLPDKASVKEEIDWIKSHPAMMRKSRMKDKLTEIAITIDDLLMLNGKCPSKSAAVQLQNFVNKPAEFFKATLSENKKISEKGGNEQAAQRDKGLDEIRALLEDVLTTMEKV